MAHPKHQTMRLWYGFRCGYCGISETEAGGELTVDHYWPVSLGGDDDENNLVYACFRCNLYKTNLAPLEKGAEPEVRILHPLLDEVERHLRETESGHLEALTATGESHIQSLRLNRAELVTCRLSRRLITRLTQQVEQIAQENVQLRRQREIRDKIILALLFQLRDLSE